MFVVTPATTPVSGIRFPNSIARLIKKNILKPVDRTSAALRDIAPAFLQASSAAITFIFNQQLSGKNAGKFPGVRDVRFNVMFNNVCAGVKI